MERTRKRSLLHCLMLSCFVFVMILTSIAPAYAKNTEQKVVRVGWYESEFNHLEENGYRSGYGYEYQQKISSYTGWKYEYVKGDWYELLDKLEKGEIDLLSKVSVTTDREKNMLFSSQPMGEEAYALIVSSDNKEIVPEDLSKLNGTKIGVAKGGYVRSLYEKWAAKNNIKATIVEVDIDKETEYLKNNKVDAVVASSSFKQYTDGSLPIAFIGNYDYNFAINKNKPELKKQLDSAMNQIYTHNNSYNRELTEKYISSNGINRYFTATEVSYLKKHGKIRVGYKDDYFPYSGTEDGKVSGVLNEELTSFKTAMKNSEVDFEFVPYTTTEEAVEAVRKGEIDLAYPVMYGDYDAEKRDLLLTKKVAESKMDAVVRKTSTNLFNTSKPQRVAVLTGESSQESIVKSSYPNWTLVTFDTVDECFDAIKNNKADCFIICDYRLHLLDSQMSEYNLSYVGIETSAVVRFATRKNDVVLCGIMNKLIGTLNMLDVSASLSQYAARNRSVGIREFVRDNIMISILAVVLLLAFFNLAIALILRVKKASEHDALTGLNNRRSYHQQLRKIKVTKNKNVCIIGMDVNGLKQINDNYGHQSGDALIKAASETIVEALGHIGTCYRTGGDEFEAIILNQNIDREELRERIKELSSHWSGEHGEVLSISVGIAVSSEQDPKTVDELIGIADREMYQDKRQYYTKKENDRREDNI